MVRVRDRIGRRAWVVVVAVLVIAVGGGTALALTGGAVAAQPRQVLVAASIGTLRTTAAASGTIEPAQQADLSFPVSGRVTRVAVRAGQLVSAGQPLASLDSAALAATAAQDQASVDGDSARLSADGTANAGSAQLAADQAALTAAQSQLANGQQALAEATLTSPIAGTVAAVNITAGQQIAGTGTTAAGSGSAASAADVVVVSTSSFVVTASVDDTVVGQVKAGDQAVITPDGAVSPVYGVVSTVAILPSSTTGVPSYPVSIAVTGDPPGLYPGAGAAVSITLRQLTNVLEVPAAALHYAGGQPTVTVWRHGTGHRQPVVVGAVSAGMAQVRSGLSAGEQVVVTRAVRGGVAGAARGAGRGAGRARLGGGGRLGGGLGAVGGGGG